MADQRLSADLFEPLIGQAFAVELKDGKVPLILRSMTRLPPPRRWLDSPSPSPPRNTPTPTRAVPAWPWRRA